ncbi:MAG: phosphopantetheine-binding protein [Rhodospirillaceae bacterium]|nr:phosphopantetheine-binding protein [Rhodospirillaceae bacterium]MCY4239729.1 phosphopantetheine-binding protein [Rhodospirillaceae bacterium]MCY4310718.1 phosphopantetheine-binding protein [Rhodospirillaceae bacterium]
MTDEEIEEKIRDIFEKEGKIDRSSLDKDTVLEDLNIASLDMVQILFGIEETFDVYVPQDDENFRLGTMQDVLDGVRKLMKERADS